MSNSDWQSRIFFWTKGQEIPSDIPREELIIKMNKFNTWKRQLGLMVLALLIAIGPTTASLTTAAGTSNGVPQKEKKDKKSKKDSKETSETAEASSEASESSDKKKKKKHDSETTEPSESSTDSKSKKGSKKNANTNS